jgi:pyruvate formate lyase activating enzyme
MAPVLVTARAGVPLTAGLLGSFSHEPARALHARCHRRRARGRHRACLGRGTLRSLPLFAAALANELDDARFSQPGDLWTAMPDGAARCLACAHRCVVGPGSRGSCGVRSNRAGALHVPFGYVARRYVRSVETNTVFHVLPGAKALTFGMFGCDLSCPYCHNHRVSQALRDGAHEEHATPISAEQLVDEAIAEGCQVVCAAYNEPMVSAEWAKSVFALAQARGLRTALISDGHSTREALEYMRGVTDVLRIDLKAHDEATYRKLGGRFQPVLDAIALGRKLGYWIEVVTLVVPGLNQDERALARIGGCLREIDAAIPWHLNAFVPRYRLRDAPPASASLLMMAAGAAYVAGSRFVYVGNTVAAAELAHTRCPACHTVVIRRHDYQTVEDDLDAGRCPRCGLALEGRWHVRDFTST